jgi:hypothetical protein
MESQLATMKESIRMQVEIIERLMNFIKLVSEMQPASDAQAQLVSIAKQIVATQK